jgi:maltose O-acetyltransferase
MNRNYDPKPKYFNLNYEPIIGKSVSLVNTLLDCNNQIIIGDYVSFGHDCQILTGLHDYHLTGEERQLSIPSNSVVIGDGAWIASRVTILPGVTIGKNSVVGAGSVVTHDIPDNQVWVGVPARYLKDI